MNAADVMTTKVITVTPESSIEDAAKLMLQYRISGLPVVDQKGVLVGMVTEGDFLRRGETGTQRRRPRWLEFILGPGRLSSEYVQAHGRKIADVMTSDPISITEDVSLEDVVDALERHRVKRLPVMRDGKLVGIVSRANLVQALATVLPRRRTPARGFRDPQADPRRDRPPPLGREPSERDRSGRSRRTLGNGSR